MKIDAGERFMDENKGSIYRNKWADQVGEQRWYIPYNGRD